VLGHAAISTGVSSDHLVFFGGTALSRTHLADARLSEDIDLIAQGARGQVAEQIERAVWIDRGTPSDLYDLWAMSERDLIGPSALQVFIAHGPFGTPPAAWVFGQDLDEGEWTRVLGHQTQLRVSAREAMTAVRQAWLRAAA